MPSQRKPSSDTSGRRNSDSTNVDGPEDLTPAQHGQVIRLADATQAIFGTDRWYSMRDVIDLVLSKRFVICKILCWLCKCNPNSLLNSQRLAGFSRYGIRIADDAVTTPTDVSKNIAEEYIDLFCGDVVMVAHKTFKTVPDTISVEQFLQMIVRFGILNELEMAVLIDQQETEFEIITTEEKEAWKILTIPGTDPALVVDTSEVGLTSIVSLRKRFHTTTTAIVSMLETSHRAKGPHRVLAEAAAKELENRHRRGMERSPSLLIWKPRATGEDVETPESVEDIAANDWKADLERRLAEALAKLEEAQRERAEAEERVTLTEARLAEEKRRAEEEKGALEEKVAGVENKATEGMAREQQAVERGYQLEKELQARAAELQEAERRGAEAEAARSDLEGRLEARTAELQEAERRAAEAEAARSDLEGRLEGTLEKAQHEQYMATMQQQREETERNLVELRADLERIQQRATVLEEEKAVLQREKEKLEGEEAEGRKMMKDADATLEQIRQRAADLERIAEDRENKLKVLEESLEESQERATRAAEKLRQHEQRMRELEASSTRELQQKTAECEETSRARTALEGQVAALQLELESTREASRTEKGKAEQDRAALEGRVEDLKREVEELRVLRDEAEQRVGSMEGAAEMAVEELKREKKMKEQLERDVEGLRVELAERAREHTEMTERLRSKLEAVEGDSKKRTVEQHGVVTSLEREKDMLMAEVESVRADFTAKQKELQQVQESKSLLEKEAQDLRHEMSVLQSTLASVTHLADEEKGVLMRQVEDLTEQLTSCKTSATETEKALLQRLLEMEDKYNHQEDGMKLSRQAEARQRDEIAALRADLDLYTAHIDKANEQKAALQQEVQDLQRKLKDEQDERQRLAQAVARQETALAASKSAVGESAASVRALRKHAEETEKELQQVRWKLRDTELEAEKAERRLSGATAELEALQKVLDQRTTELRTAQDGAAVLAEDVERARVDRSQLRRKYQQQTAEALLSATTKGRLWYSFGLLTKLRNQRQSDTVAARAVSAGGEVENLRVELQRAQEELAVSKMETERIAMEAVSLQDTIKALNNKVASLEKDSQQHSEVATLRLRNRMAIVRGWVLRVHKLVRDVKVGMVEATACAREFPQFAEKMHQRISTAVRDLASAIPTEVRMRTSGFACLALEVVADLAKIREDEQASRADLMCIVDGLSRHGERFFDTEQRERDLIAEFEAEWRSAASDQAAKELTLQKHVEEEKLSILSVLRRNPPVTLPESIEYRAAKAAAEYTSRWSEVIDKQAVQRANIEVDEAREVLELLDATRRNHATLTYHRALLREELSQRTELEMEWLAVLDEMARDARIAEPTPRNVSHLFPGVGDFYREEAARLEASSLKTREERLLITRRTLDESRKAAEHRKLGPLRDAPSPRKQSEVTNDELSHLKFKYHRQLATLWAPPPSEWRPIDKPAPRLPFLT